jgi:hypothetical protein
LKTYEKEWNEGEKLFSWRLADGRSPLICMLMGRKVTREIDR